MVQTADVVVRGEEIAGLRMSRPGTLCGTRVNPVERQPVDNHATGRIAGLFSQRRRTATATLRLMAGGFSVKRPPARIATAARVLQAIKESP